MIITRTPYRLSFFGGGTDHPSWYNENESIILSTTFNKYCHINLRNLPPYFNFRHRLRYFLTEQVSKINDIKHPVIREVLKLKHYNKGIEMIHSGDIPARSGVGSSSSFTVGFINAINTQMGYFSSKRELALQAIEIEQKILKENIGSQDQIAAAFGGFNQIVFKGNNFNVEPIILEKNNLNLLQDSLIFCYTGHPRNSDQIAKKQISNIPKKKFELSSMTDLSRDALKILQNKNLNIKEFGKLLNEQWKLKKDLNPYSTNSLIDRLYKMALNNGAYGGKITGAGAGGFLVLIAPKYKHNILKKKLSKFLIIPIKFENSGTKIIYYSHE